MKCRRFFGVLRPDITVTAAIELWNAYAHMQERQPLPHLAAARYVATLLVAVPLLHQLFWFVRARPYWGPMGALRNYIKFSTSDPYQASVMCASINSLAAVAYAIAGLCLSSLEPAQEQRMWGVLCTVVQVHMGAYCIYDIQAMIAMHELFDPVFIVHHLVFYIAVRTGLRAHRIAGCIALLSEACNIPMYVSVHLKKQGIIGAHATLFVLMSVFLAVVWPLTRGAGFMYGAHRGYQTGHTAGAAGLVVLAIMSAYWYVKALRGAWKVLKNLS